MSEVRCSYCGSTFEAEHTQVHKVFCAKRDLHHRRPGIDIPMWKLLFVLFVSAVVWALFWWTAFAAQADHGADWELKNELPTSAVESFETAHPTTTTTTVPAGPVERWRPLVEAYDWDTEHMLRIMRCESRGIPTAASHTDDHGLFQIHYPIWGPAYDVSRTDLYDPVLNTDVAYRVFAQQGYGAWVCHRIIS